VKVRACYDDLLGCPDSRSLKDSVDLKFCGHQIIAYLAAYEAGHRATSEMDGDNVRVRPFGVILPMQD
jgi:uncharacterized protein